MTSAVIVSTARTPLAKSWKGAFNMTHGATLGGHAVKAAVERAGIEPARGRRRDHGLRDARGRHRQQHRAPDRAARRPADHDQRHDRQPLLLERPADDRDGGAARHRRRERHRRRRRRRVDLVRAERGQQAHARRPVAGRATSRRSTGTCCRPPSRSPSATTSPRQRMDEYGAASQQKATAARDAGQLRRRDRSR